MRFLRKIQRAEQSAMVAFLLCTHAKKCPAYIKMQSDVIRDIMVNLLFGIIILQHSIGILQIQQLRMSEWKKKY